MVYTGEEYFHVLNKVADPGFWQGTATERWGLGEVCFNYDLGEIREKKVINLLLPSMQNSPLNPSLQSHENGGFSSLSQLQVAPLWQGLTTHGLYIVPGKRKLMPLYIHVLNKLGVLHYNVKIKY